MIQYIHLDKKQEPSVSRFLLVKFKCPNCREFVKAIKLINLKLPVDRRIEIIDFFAWEEYGVELEPIMRKFKELEEGFPLCFLTKEGINIGILLQPASPETLKIYLNKFFEDEYL